MIVIFISQCEKRALKKTRHILDNFAIRNGSNSWITPITEKGLETVHTLLRKEAQRNTSVACYKVTTRQSFKLQWVVGNRSNFNNIGATPILVSRKKKSKFRIKLCV